MENRKGDKGRETPQEYRIHTSNQNEKAELLKLECTNCGATLDLVDKTHAVCPYCGQKYLIDEAKGTIVNIQVDYSGNEDMVEAVSSAKKVLIIFLIVASLIALIIFGFNIAAKKSVFSTSDSDLPVDANGQLLVIFCQDIFEKDFEAITKEELASIRYLRCAYEREGSETFNKIFYSFANYEDCENEEEFQDTIKTWTYRTKRVSWPSDYTMFTGLTRIDNRDAVWLSLLKFSPDARISRVDTDDKLDTVSTILNPEYITTLHIGIMGTSVEGIGQYKNLEELEVDTNLTNQSMDVSGIEECKKLQVLRLRCGEQYTGLENLKELSELKSLYIDHVLLEDCGFLKDLPGLESLSIYTGENASLSLFDSIPNLKQVDFLDSEYILPSELHHLQNIQALTIAVKEKEGLEELAALTSLQTLKLHMSIHEYQAFVDVSALARLENLERIYLDNFWGGEITGIEPILNLPKLTVFRLGHYGAADTNLLLDPGLLEENPSLLEAGFFECRPENIATGEEISFSFLTHYPNIKRLYLDGCEQEDISFISALTDLRRCSLQDNKIQDLSPLLACKKLEAVSADKETAVGVRFSPDVQVNTEIFVKIYD
ncbi:MAG: leucine-rich repeat domain-containing protein [Lachnospiraceae bacterium]|jgi:Leucine-rich repeat (LRR) protein/DNA-directed RNA polymerase subunit RPC12/RpoP|nr:leucine-rich repeat domain-containing protein [Lachnospiraceae bacterium]